MVQITEVVNARGLDFQNQRKVMHLRAQSLPFSEIAQRVRNLKGKKSCEDVVRRVHNKFSSKKGRVVYRYSRCGRKPWKITKAIGKYILQRLRQLRKKTVCTSVSLQAVLYKEKSVHISTAAIRKHLAKNGYHWLPRAQKRKYGAAARAARLAFATRISRMSDAALRQHVSLAMDGVVLTIAPPDPVDRQNYCLHGETHMWRTRTEAASPELSGGDPYADQVTLARALPLWGAISPAGFRAVIFHKNKKLSTQEWKDALKAGKLMTAIQELQPGRHSGARRLLCDNERFLMARDSREYYSKKNVQLLQIPARSPDLNPIESFWGWLRKQLRLRDLQDLRSGRPALGKTACKARVQALLRSRKAQDVAKAKFSNLRRVCKEVVQKKGAASRC